MANIALLPLSSLAVWASASWVLRFLDRLGWWSFGLVVGGREQQKAAGGAPAAWW
jgi:hypothetical protein